MVAMTSKTDFSVPANLVRPECSFASDNAAGAHPAVIEAMMRANKGHALAYGEDAETKRCQDAFGELFDRDLIALPVFNGTGANVMVLADQLRAGDGVVCTDWAHINCDETAAPEFVAGAKLLAYPAAEAKLTPHQIREAAGNIGVVHHAQPRVVSITQSTELGTLYSIEEIDAIAETAHEFGLVVHLDGARIANAVAAIGGGRETLRNMTKNIDIISFGGTKPGAVAAEAVIYLNVELASRASYVRKAVNQLSSKMRFISAQFNALLEDDLWIDLAGQANEMATELYRRAAALDGVTISQPPAVNSVFPILDPVAGEALRQWCFFWPWDPARNQYRWMTSWDTTSEDIDRFCTAIEVFLAN